MTAPCSLSVFGSLKWKMAVFTGSLVVLACLLVGAFLWIRHATALTQSLLLRGETLARQLSVTGRYSVMTRDTTRLNELIDGAFQTPDVAYVVFTDPADVVIASRERSLPPRTRLRLSSPPSTPSQDTASIASLLFQDGIAIPDRQAPLIPWHAILPPIFEHATGCYYDVAVPMLPPSVRPDEDDILLPPSRNREGVKTRSGIVHVGLSDSPLRKFGS
jgi:hypothetical protein